MKTLNTELVQEFNELKKCSDYYYNHSTSLLSDAEFDKREETLLKKVDNDMKNVLFKQLHFQTSRDTDWEVKPHKVPCKSLEKITYDEFEEGLKDYLELVNPITDSLSLQLKMDGLTVSLNYEDDVLVSAILRGGGLEGEDVKNNIKFAKGVSKFLPIGTGSLIAEIILLKSDFEKINDQLRSNDEKEFKVVRNASSGIARNFDNKFSHMLSVRYFDIEVEGKEFNTIRDKFDYMDLELKLDREFLVDKNFYYMDECSELSDDDFFEHLKCKYNRIMNDRESYDFEIDGIVLKPNTINDKTKEYNSKGNPSYSVAIKFSNKFKSTKPVGIDYQYGKTGRVTPVLNYESFELDGRVFSNASIHNIVRFKELQLGMDSEVEIMIGGDIIPTIKSNTKSDTPFEIPTHCEHCNSVLVYEQSYLFCRNMECSCNVVGTIHNFFKKISVKNIAEKTIEVIVEYLTDVKQEDVNILSMYKLEPSDLLQIDGFKDASSKKTIKSIQKVNKLHIGVLLGSLNIPEISRKTGQKLIEALRPNNLDDIFDYSLEEIVAINGFAEITASNFISGINSRKEIIYGLCEILDVDFTVVEASGKLLGKKICMTGTLPIKRDEFKKMVVDNGAKAVGSVSKTTDYLVLGSEGEGTGKHTKAIENDVEIISYDEFLELL